VQWEGNRQGEGVMVLSAPGEASGHVILPVEVATGTVSVDGNLVWDRGALVPPAAQLQSDGLHLSITGGSHVVEFWH
jgi:hypothetical protein